MPGSLVIRDMELALPALRRAQARGDAAPRASARTGSRTRRRWPRSSATSVPLATTRRRDRNPRILAQPGEVIERSPERDKFVKPLPTAEQQALAALVTRRRQLIAMLVAERNRLVQSPAAIPQSIVTIIEALTTELDRIGSDMAGHVQANFADLSALLDSVTGVGKTTISTLICEVPELSRLSRREIGADWCCTDQPRLRPYERKAHDLRWPQQRAACALYGDTVRDSLQPRHQDLL